eukprot:660784-Rhodomonas_salina.1
MRCPRIVLAGGRDPPYPPTHLLCAVPYSPSVCYYTLPTPCPVRSERMAYATTLFSTEIAYAATRCAGMALCGARYWAGVWCYHLRHSCMEAQYGAR